MMPQPKMIVAFFLAAFGGISQSVSAQRHDDQVDDEAIFRIPLARGQAETVEPLILSLGANTWKERVEATNTLLEMGAGAMPFLRSAYCRTDDLEIQLRIEEIVTELYERYGVYDRVGFLGISQHPIPKTHDDFSQIPIGHLGIQIEQVHQGTGAEAADLRKGDVIYAIDDEPIPESMQPAVDFGSRIRGLGPGATVTLSVLRRGRPLRLSATLGQCPEDLVNPRSLPTVFEQLQMMQQRFPGWWARHFTGTACKQNE